MASSISYRRNRDYTKSFKWTYELDKELYQCYIKAKSDPRIGYMNRLKQYWDEKHPELNTFSSKNLRDHVSSIIKRKVIMETDFNIEHQDNITESNNVIHNIVNSVDNIGEETIETSNSSTNVSPEIATIKSNIRETLLATFEDTLQYDLEDRKINTKLNKKLDQNVITAVNELSNEILHSINEPSYRDINCLIYASAITCKTFIGDIQPTPMSIKNNPKFPNWINNIEQSIARIRKELSQINVLIKCKTENAYTRHQKALLQKYSKKLGNTKLRTLTYKTTVLKQELKSKSEKVKYQKKQMERKRINATFNKNPKKIYRSFKEKGVTIKTPPAKDEIETFWKGIWNSPSEFKGDNTPWMKVLNREYCKNIINNEYNITLELVKKAINKMQPNKAPGRDLITACWYKKLTFYRPLLTKLFTESFKGELELPCWLTTASTVLQPKNDQTHIAKNYRPIALLNIMYKIYTSCLNTFLNDHLMNNNIITPEQAGGKQGVWGTTEQLLINKTIVNDAKQKRRKLIKLWLDYKKAFDSIPHTWLIKALHLAKLPIQLINAIETLTQCWYTRVTLNSESETLTTNIIKFLKGIFQGDSLSVSLFVICLNPLSFLLKRVKGYALGQGRSIHHTQNFFVDNLKLYAQTTNSIKKQLDIITTFSKDIGMTFGEDKCAFMEIHKGNMVNNLEPLVINNLTIKPIQHGDSYRYLGIDENISYSGPLNKEKICKEYLYRIRKIWLSELTDFNKMIAHNSFAIPIFTTTVGILDWTINEINEVDVKTRKVLTMTGSFHPNSDIDKLYISRKSGGRGLKSMKILFESRILALRQHLRQSRERSDILTCMYESEETNIVRLGNELLQSHEIQDDHDETAKAVSKKYIINKQKQLINN